ncbi:aminopeptidase N-like [Ptychodera flava]|uniref:aminopeptidase N-like n=1 Tax=Ptychodera flava TaxID=63121 RepID=UPI003969E74C
MAYSNHTEKDVDYIKKKRGGCFVSTLQWFIIVVLVAVIITVSVLIAYYVPKSSCDDTPADPVSGLPPQPDEPEDVHNPTEARLPGNVEPEHYTVDIKTYLDETDGEHSDKQFSFEGTVHVDIICFKTTNTITLHAHSSIYPISMTFGHKTHQGELEDLTIVGWNRDLKPEYEFLNIILESNIEAGEKYLLKIAFNGTLIQPDLLGYYVSNYTVDGEEGERHLACTQFGLTYARRGFPCFDEPALKATFDIILEHRDSRSALSNMPIIKIEPGSEDGWLRTHFDTTLTMSTYVIALVISDFVNITRYTESSIPVSVWAPEDRIEAFEYAVDMATQQVDIFEKLYRIPYAPPKLDNVAIPNFYFSGMENWGVVLYRDSRIAYTPGIDTPYQKQRSNSLVSHEVAHQWFGDLVTCQWWDHTWLNEGITSFVEYIGSNHTEPDWQVFEQVFQWSDLYAAMNVDSSGDSHPVIYQVGTTSSEVLAVFDTISYQKGASLVHMMADFLTPVTLTEGFTLYLNSHNYSNVVSDDLFRALTKVDIGRNNVDVKKIMDTWTLQMGYPVVNVSRDKDDPTIIHTTQQHFLLDPTDRPTDKYGDMGYKWYVMLTYTHEGDQTFDNVGRTWQNRGPADVQMTGVTSDDWVLFNVHNVGYYRVNYEPENWEKLAQQLLTEHKVIPIRSRTELLSDSFTLSHGHQLDQLTAWKLTEYLSEEEEYNPWRATTDNIATTKTMLKRTTAYGYYQKYMRNLIHPMYTKYGWDFTDEEFLVYMSTMTAINVACGHAHASCVEECKDQYHQWIDTGNNTIRADTKTTVYCTAIRYGGDVEWEFAMEMYESKLTDPTDRSYLQATMACTHIPYLLSRYLEYSLTWGWANTGIHNARRYSAVGFSIAWTFTMDNFDELLETYGDAAYDIVWGFSDEMNTRREKEMLEEFAELHNDMPENAASNFYAALHRIELSIIWMDRNYDQLKLWFQEKTKDSI